MNRWSRHKRLVRGPRPFPFVHSFIELTVNCVVLLPLDRQIKLLRSLPHLCPVNSKQTSASGNDTTRFIVNVVVQCCNLKINFVRLLKWQVYSQMALNSYSSFLVMFLATRRTPSIGISSKYCSLQCLPSERFMKPFQSIAPCLSVAVNQNEVLTASANQTQQQQWGEVKSNLFTYNAVVVTLAQATQVRTYTRKIQFADLPANLFISFFFP